MGAEAWVNLLGVVAGILTVTSAGLVGKVWDLSMKVHAMVNDTEHVRELELKVNTLENKLAFYEAGMLEMKRFLDSQKRHEP